MIIKDQKAKGIRYVFDPRFDLVMTFEEYENWLLENFGDSSYDVEYKIIKTRLEIETQTRK
jgi:hypothetical protein